MKSSSPRGCRGANCHIPLGHCGTVWCEPVPGQSMSSTAGCSVRRLLVARLQRSRADKGTPSNSMHLAKQNLGDRTCAQHVQRLPTFSPCPPIPRRSPQMTWSWGPSQRAVECMTTRLSTLLKSTRRECASARRRRPAAMLSPMPKRTHRRWAPALGCSRTCGRWSTPPPALQQPGDEREP